SLSRIFFFQNKYLIKFFSCVYLSSHTVCPFPLIFSSGLGTGNGYLYSVFINELKLLNKEILELKIKNEILCNDKDRIKEEIVRQQFQNGVGASIFLNSKPLFYSSTSLTTRI
ncbi:hypothetical protein BpHYR1_000510, partial [Brachionus plicatilis]